jgi:hypothetical protein
LYVFGADGKQKEGKSTDKTNLVPKLRDALTANP